MMARKYQYGGNIISVEQLRALEHWVAGQIGADSVKYNSLKAFVDVWGFPRQISVSRAGTVFVPPKLESVESGEPEICKNSPWF
jgi:hypothetical protein